MNFDHDLSSDEQIDVANTLKQYTMDNERLNVNGEQPAFSQSPKVIMDNNMGKKSY